MIVTIIVHGNIKDPFVTIDRDRKGVSIRGLQITFEPVRKGLSGAISKAQNLMNEVFGGTEHPEVTKKIEALHNPSNTEYRLPDDLHNRKVGYGPFTDPENPLFEHRYDLFTALMKQNTVTGKNKLYNQYGNGLKFTPDEVRAFFDRVDAFVEVRLTHTLK